MRNLYKYIGCMASLLLGLTACYDDKGNYDYWDINQVVVEIPETTVRLKRTESVEFVVDPELKQNIAQNEDALRYKWYVGGKESYMICEKQAEECTDKDHFHFYSEGKVFRMNLDASFRGSLVLMLELTDLITETKYYQTHSVKVIHPFSNTWFVLQSENGKGKLGAVDGIQKDAMIFADVFQSEFSTTFPMEGLPQSIESRHFYGAKYYTGANAISSLPPIEPMLIVRTDKDLQVVYPTTLKTKYTIEEMLLGAKVDNATAWNPQTYTYSHWGELVYDQGKLWHSLMDGFALYYRVMDSKTGKQVNSPWVADLGTSFVIYNEDGKNFSRLSYNESMDLMTITRGYTTLLRKAPEYYGEYGAGGNKEVYPLESNGEIFDPNDISKDMGENLKMRGLLSSGSRVMALTTLDGQTLTIFELSNTSEPCTGKYELNLPAPADRCKFIAAQAYDRMFFMATGNSLYKVDLNRQTPVVSKIYEHENAGAVIDALKFKERCVPSAWDTENIMNKYQMQLGLGINMPDGTASVVDLVLTSAGDVNRAEGSIYEYPGFNHIVDIAYNYGDE